MSTLIKTTSDGRKVEVIGYAIYLDGKKEADKLIEISEHPNRRAILDAVPDATHVAGRLPLNADQAATAHAAIEKAKAEYDASPIGIAERMRAATNDMLSKRSDE